MPPRRARPAQPARDELGDEAPREAGTPPWMAGSDADGRLLLRVRVTPRASRVGIAAEGETLRVRLTAPPVEGAANEALVALFAAHLRLPKRAVTLVRGATSREKTLAVAGLAPGELSRRLGL